MNGGKDIAAKPLGNLGAFASLFFGVQLYLQGLIVNLLLPRSG